MAKSKIHKPLVSICIPTYNRAAALKESLDSLICQNGFSKIEVVVSDNCSTDDTRSVAESYAKQYPNIKYFRNEENIHDRNFPTAIMRASGVYRKLFNDTCVYEIGSLDYLLDVVQKYERERPFLFLTTDFKIKKNDDDLFCANSLSEFLNFVSYRMTWIGSFGLWEDDCSRLTDEFDCCSTSLWQVYKTCQVVSKKKKTIFLTRPMLHLSSAINSNEKKDRTYGVFKVFYENYFNILKPYLEDGTITEECFKKLKKDVLYGQFLELFISIPLKNENVGDEKNYKQLVHEAYKSEPYYWHFCFVYRIKYVLEKLRLKRERFFISLRSKKDQSHFARFLLTAKRKLRLKLY